MNWEAIGAVGEILGAIAVVTTLGYLAVQIKLARTSSALQGNYSSHESYSRWRIAMMENPDLAKTITKANLGEPLAADEQILLTTLTNELFIGSTVSAATNRQTHLFYDPSTEVAYLMSILAANRGLIQYWHNCKEMIRSVSPEHVAAIDAAVSQLPSEEL